MGVALAEEARRRGAEVVLLAANLAVAAPAGVETIATPTAEAMLEAALALADVDLALLAAAVADYRPAAALAGKRAKSGEPWTLELEPTADIARLLGERKRPGQVLVAFGAEHGEEGLERKRAHARRQERRPRRLQRRLARRHRLRRGRERGRARHPRGERRVPEGAQAGRRRRDPRRGRAPARGSELTDAYEHFQEGRRRLKKGMPAQATVALEKAKRLEPDKASIREALGIAYFRLRRWAGGRGGVPRVLELSPTDHYAHYALGRALEKQGRAAEANGHYKLASSMGPASRAVRGADPRARRVASRVRAVVQRVARAQVTPGGEIGPGLCVLLGVADADDEATADRLAGKVARLRIFEDDDGKFDRSLLDTGGAALVVSQFTLIADTREGQPPELRRRRTARARGAALRALLPRRSATLGVPSRPASSARGWSSSS